MRLRAGLSRVRPVARWRQRFAGDWWALLLVPAMVWLGIFFLFPVGRYIARSFSYFQAPQKSGFDNYTWFFSTPVNITVLQRTFVLSLVVTLICLLLAYPYAYLMTFVNAGWRVLMIIVVLAPFWTSPLVRNFAWISLLQDNGVINDALAWLGFGRIRMLGEVKGVAIGMVHITLPFMILPLFATLEKIDRRLLDAAASLGARPSVAFVRIYIPLSFPGIVSGSLLVFVVSLGFYLTPAMLGSPQQSMLSQLVVTQVAVLGAWGRSGAMGAVLLAATLALLGLAALAARRSTLVRSRRTLP
jgi:putative spermidine/putrescine transport system permease protein